MGDDPILVIVKGLDGSGSFHIGQNRTVLGRDASADIVFDSEHISRHHLEITRSGTSLTVRDLGSTNGTTLNGSSIGDQPSPLTYGDQIGIADELVVLRLQPGGSTVPLSDMRAASTNSRDLELNLASRDVWLRGSTLEPRLSRKEFDVLAELFERSGEAVSRDDIAHAGWPERDGQVGEDEITQLIRRIRRRVDGQSGEPKILATVRGFGYKLEIERTD